MAEGDGSRTRGTNNLEAWWMPFTANRQFKKAPRLLVAARGMHYRDADGRQILDGTAGLWCVNAGHCRPKITEAIRQQAGELDYAPAFQLGHPKAFELANRLIDIARGFAPRAILMPISFFCRATTAATRPYMPTTVSTMAVTPSSVNSAHPRRCGMTSVSIACDIVVTSVSEKPDAAAVARRLPAMALASRDVRTISDACPAPAM